MRAFVLGGSVREWGVGVGGVCMGCSIAAAGLYVDFLSECLAPFGSEIAVV